LFDLKKTLMMLVVMIIAMSGCSSMTEETLSVVNPPYDVDCSHGEEIRAFIELIRMNLESQRETSEMDSQLLETMIEVSNSEIMIDTYKLLQDGLTLRQNAKDRIDNILDNGNQD
jgi:23S rRNA G2445 N2-methylase RlmL